MNTKLIQQLAQQAEEYADTMCSERTLVLDPAGWNSVFQERFVELVLQEAKSVSDYDSVRRIDDIFGVEQ